jgi:aminoglycoside phosphotransferase (APT) family kinase protein
MAGKNDWKQLVDPQALTAWMDGQGLGHGAIEDAAALTGGTQNLLLGFRRAGRGYVLRRPPLHPGSNGNEAMAREARVLAAIASSAVPHARLIAACPDTSVLGAAFYLMEPVDGFAPIGELPEVAHAPYYQHGIGLAMVDAIAALGQLDVNALGLAGLGKLDGYLERQVPRWRAALAKYAAYEGWPGPASLPHVVRVGDWLEAHRPASFTPGLVHGDFHLGNVMFGRERCELAAVVDWELTTIGDPLIDLGWLVATWPTAQGAGLPRLRARPWTHFATAPELIERYRQQTGRDLADLQWYVVLSCFKLAIILEGTHARACAGKAPRDVGDELHQSAVWLLERARLYLERHPADGPDAGAPASTNQAMETTP